jgi:hypothetical protein
MNSPTRIQLIDVHSHLAAAIFALAETIKKAGPAERAQLAEIARLLTDAQQRISAVSRSRMATAPLRSGESR